MGRLVGNRFGNLEITGREIPRLGTQKTEGGLEIQRIGSQISK